MYICKYALVFYGEKGYNDLNITETIDKPRSKKLERDSLNMEVLSGIAESTIRRVLENRYGEIISDKNKTHGYYIVNWDIPPHKLQEDTDIFQAGGIVCNATYINPIQQAHHWYTQSTTKIVVHIQHVLAANLELQKPSLSIKLPNTFNHRENVWKGATKLPDHLHKGQLVEIIHRGALDFIEHDKDGHQDEYEGSNNDASVLSPDE